MTAEDDSGDDDDGNSGDDDDGNSGDNDFLITTHPSPHWFIYTYLCLCASDFPYFVFSPNWLYSSMI